MVNLVILIIGLTLGAVVVFIINWLYRREAKVLAQELIQQTEFQKIQDLEVILGRIKESFGTISFDSLTRTREEFYKYANETFSKYLEMGEKELEGKKRLIDQTLDEMKKELQRVQELVNQFERDREQKFGEISNQLKFTAEQTRRLQETTNQIRSVLSNTKVRGQWGERMAEDILRLAGFVEGINYQKQKTLDATSSRPDYTFFLPQGLKVNMDVKFPLDNYLRYLEVEGETDKEKYKVQFLKDVKNRIKEVVNRNYINPEENTVDYVIVFIPNEQVYSFINENDSSILDEALKNKVILCSPVTLYAILALIRQAVDNFNLERTASQILSLMGTFYNQWKLFIQSVEKVGKKIEEAQKEYNTLISTRRNQLERPLIQIEELRKENGIAEILSTKDETSVLKAPEDEK